MPVAYEIRLARPEEYSVIGELTLRVYLSDGLTAHDSAYVSELRDAVSRAKETDLIVGADSGTGQVLGAVSFVLPGSTYAELAGEREAEFRMLVVDPRSRGVGLGSALIAACVERARAVGCTTLRLSSQPVMRAAHRLYERLGFRRTPDRDRSPMSGVELIAYALDLGAVYCDRCGEPLGTGVHEECSRARELEPPRWCSYCRRRLVVQVVPTGWSARCPQHGLTAS